MTRGEWADFADWLDARYSPSKWLFYRDHDRQRALLRESESLDTNTEVGNTVVLYIAERITDQELTLIKLFQPSASTVTRANIDPERTIR